MIDLSDRTECFYIPGHRQIIDAINPETGKGHYSGQTLEEVRAEDGPEVQIGNLDEVSSAIEELFKEAPRRTTEEDWNQMLECLPPLNWENNGATETFMMCEMTSGTITTIFCRIGEVRYSLQNSRFLKHAEIVALCRGVE